MSEVNVILAPMAGRTMSPPPRGGMKEGVLNDELFRL